ncbi:DMT family transporter [Bordetella pseudohinzii]|uniref:Aromatic amino acid exporter n=1 Tax=Bordetella pseudohinzii TaxID=1331258 RepID=A0A0J6C745_9BORD|nr:DMT family transporter [Bordetella pseudohinzii]ANY17822.1 multidrug DMT transporter [Bordetella pseudohinzii]KMM26541.1 multidrug DMT transporter [Bordetella pseudohinzii]KXA77136.1 multidrug DMT transporter [Bordetella pseudohinzii]KXA77452.1 multidrug DMT transporter [Bordetella pseudohinzii]CUI77359.1 aromatic amino acid exporter [Bordetella pseudohinzii]
MPPLSFLYPLAAILLWAGNVMVSKLSARSIDPLAITFWRLALAVAVMSLFVAGPAWRNRAAIRPQLHRLACLGFLSMVLFQCLSYEAAHSTSATNMAIMTSLVPLLTMLLSVWILREPPTLGMLAGGLLSFLGLVYLISGGDPASLLAGGAHIGDILMLIASLAYALYGVLLKRWQAGLPAWQSNYIQGIASLIMMGLLTLRLPPEAVLPTRASLPLIAYAGLCASVLLPVLWMHGVKLLGPNRCAMYMNFLPVFTAAIAVGFFGETLHGHHLIGGGAALAGVLMAQRLRRPLRPRPALNPGSA